MDYRHYPVLVVDDEVENLDAFALNFGRKFTLRTASSGKEALEIAKSENIAVAIADQRMPGMLGTDFLAQFRKERPDAVRMILTGYTDLESVMAAINDGQISRYITKPWDARDIESVVRNAIDHYRRGLDRRRRFRELDTYNRILSMIAADRSLARVVKEVLESTAIEFGYHRTFLLLGDPAAGPLRGQAVSLEERKPRVERIVAPARGGDAPLSQVVAAKTGFSAERFTFSATNSMDSQIDFSCGPFYGAPLVVEGRVVGLLCADRGGAGKADKPGESTGRYAKPGVDRTDRDDARFISTLASQIAVATGGHLTVENLTRRTGGPKAEPESSRPSNDPSKPKRARMPKKLDYKAYPVLVVDDDPSSNEAFRLNFGNQFTVVTARDAKEGLELARTRRVAVILTDQRMPEMTGVEFLAELRDNDPDCVRMVLTGYSDIEDIIGAVNRGLVYRYITKPWEANELGNALKNAIEYYHELVESRRLLREAEVVNRIMTVVLGDSDADRVADAVLKIATTDLGYDRAYLFHYDEPSSHLVRGRAAVKEGETMPPVDRMRIPVIQGGGLLASVVLSGVPGRSSEGPHSPGGVEISVPRRKMTYAVPLGDGEHPLGVLALEIADPKARDFGPADELTALTIADVFAVTIKHARRLAELKALESKVS